MRIVMFGGSFNPVHSGHVELAEAFSERLDPDRLLIVPTFIPPHKSSELMADGAHRLEMCRIAFRDIPCAEVSDIELRRRGASYTYLTLQELHEMYPEDELFLITGADMFMSIHQWKNPEIIFSLATICGIPRNDDDITRLSEQAEYLETLGAKTIVLDKSVITVSSTRIREMIKSGGNITGLVPPGVAEYISSNGLYK